MRHVAFVAPFFLPTTLRFVGAAASLPGVRLSLISEDPVERLPTALRRRVHHHLQIEDGTDTQAIAAALNRVSAAVGPIARLLGTLEELQVPLGQLRDQLGLPGMGAGEAQNFRDKGRMKTVLRAAGLPCAKHGLARSAKEAAAIARQIGLPVIVKPPAGAGARGTQRLTDDQSLAQFLRTAAPTADAPLLIEEFVRGREHSFDSVCIDGRLVWHSINQYYPSPLEVLEHPWIQWAVLSPREVDAPEYTDIIQTAAGALSALGMGTGLSHLEWFRRPDGSLAISEVGARPPGAQFTTLISYAGDFNLYDAWAELMVFDRFRAKPRPFAAGAAFLRGQGEGRVRAIRGLEEINRRLGELIVEHHLPQAGAPPSGTYEGDGYVILRHPSTEVVKQGLADLISSIRVELA